MTDLTPEKRAELRKEWEAAVPQCIHRELVLSLLDALDAKDAELASVKATAVTKEQALAAVLDELAEAWDQGRQCTGPDEYAVNPYRRNDGVAPAKPATDPKPKRMVSVGRFPITPVEPDDDRLKGSR